MKYADIERRYQVACRSLLGVALLHQPVSRYQSVFLVMFALTSRLVLAG
jgi:hypothetical protein